VRKLKRKVSAMGILALGFLVMTTSIRTDNVTQAGESMIVSENGKTYENNINVNNITAGVMSIDKYDKIAMNESKVRAGAMAIDYIAYDTMKVNVMASAMRKESMLSATPMGNETADVICEDIESPIESNVDVETDVKTEVKAKTVVEDELYMLSHLIYAEAGSVKCSDKTRYYVGSVVLNRVKSNLFKENTIKDVIFADGQYSCTWLGTYYNEPTTRCVEIAKDLLENGSVLPENVVFQATFEQGDGIYEYIDNTYFCYKNDKK
jgi:hypothetical protein